MSSFGLANLTDYQKFDSLSSLGKGDSGGPLLHKGVIKGEVVDYLVGAVSFGGTCAAPDSAAIYSGRFENLAEKPCYLD